MTVKIDKEDTGSFWTPGHRKAWLTVACSVVFASALPTSLQAVNYYSQDDSDTSVVGFMTDSTGCGGSERDLFMMVIPRRSKSLAQTPAVPSQL